MFDTFNYQKRVLASISVSGAAVSEGGSVWKKLRTSSVCEDSSSSSCEIVQLPKKVFAHVAGYLEKPSVAMFAVAMTAPCQSWKNIANGHEKLSEASKEILSSETWEVLGFDHINDSYVNSTAGNLSDDDIHAILTCIKHRALSSYWVWMDVST